MIENNSGGIFDNVLVSVVVATFRRDNSLKVALESIINQTYDNIEIILVDDNANIEWSKKVNDIVQILNNNKIKLITNEENLGSAESRNKGIMACNGSFITFLDDDDIYLPKKVINQLNYMIKEDADYSLTNLALYNENEKLCEVRERSYLNDSKDLLVCHLKYHLTSPDTMMFKKEYLHSIGSFDPIDIGDDFYLMLKAIKGNGKFIYVPTCDVKAYVHSGENGLSSGPKKIKGEKNLYNFKKQYFPTLKRRDVRYIKMRHHAVIAYAYFRSKHYFKFFFEGFISFLIAPIASIKLLAEL